MVAYGSGAWSQLVADDGGDGRRWRTTGKKAPSGGRRRWLCRWLVADDEGGKAGGGTRLGGSGR